MLIILLFLVSVVTIGNHFQKYCSGIFRFTFRVHSFFEPLFDDIFVYWKRYPNWIPHFCPSWVNIASYYFVTIEKELSVNWLSISCFIFKGILCKFLITFTYWAIYISFMNRILFFIIICCDQTLKKFELPEQTKKYKLSSVKDIFCQLPWKR